MKKLIEYGNVDNKKSAEYYIREYKGMSSYALFQVYRSMDLDNRIEFLEEAKRTGLYDKEIKRHRK